MSRRAWPTTAALALVVVLTGCGLFDQSANEDDRFVRLDSPRTSPSGEFIASVIEGPEQDDASTLVVVITDSADQEVFRDDYAYSARHGVGVIWLSGQDQLWVLSADVGTSYVQQSEHTWVKVGITPETRDEIPDEIADLRAESEHR